MNLSLLLQQPPPFARGREFDTGVIWQTLRDLGEGFLAQLPTSSSSGARGDGSAMPKR